MRAMAAEAALERDKLIDHEGFGNEDATALEEVGDLAHPAAFPSGQSDVRVEGAALRLKADADAGPLNFGGERGDVAGSTPAHSARRCAPRTRRNDSNVERAGADAAERDGDVFRQRPLDLADEAQGQVKLALFLPANRACRPSRL